jgi:hypothetical protein
VKTNTGVEACDGLDNNCNGTVDEGFNFMTDVANCGGCNVTCSFPFATARCTNGVCRQGACLPGFYDPRSERPRLRDRLREVERRRRDLRRPGQRLRRRRRRQPDGRPARLQVDGRLRRHAADCMGQTGWVCNYPTTYQDVEDTRRAATRWTTTATAASTSRSRSASLHRRLGACANPNGMWVCDNSAMARPPAATARRSRRHRDLQRPRTTTATARSTSSTRSRTDHDDKLIYLSAPGVTMFALRGDPLRRHREQLRLRFDPPALLGPGRLPWSNVTKEEAEAACEKVGTGWRLCTSAEWLDACNSSGNTTFPYGARTAQRCNGWDFTKTAGVTTIATGACDDVRRPTVDDRPATSSTT